MRQKKNESNEEVTAVSSVETNHNTGFTTVNKKSNPLLWILLLLLLILAAICFWLWSKNKELQAAIPKPVPPKTLNAGETKLKDSLGLASGLFAVMPGSFGQTITVSDTLFVRQDTLHINGNGLVLQCDSSYQGPAFKATDNNKILILENITFKDFESAILLQGKGIQLRNVQFQNVAVPVQRQLFLPTDQAVTATIKDTVLITNDSLAVKK